MMKKMVGYFSPYEIMHESELQELKNKRDQRQSQSQSQNVPKGRLPRVPEYRQFDDTEWFIVKSRLNNRFTMKQCLIIYFRYGTRGFTFEWIIAKIQHAIDELTKAGNNGYQSKVSLLRCACYIFEQFAKDYTFNLFDQTNSSKTSLKDHIKSLVKPMIVDQVSRSITDGQMSIDNIEAEVEEVMLHWEHGCSDVALQGSRKISGKVFVQLWKILDDACPNITLKDHHAKMGPLMGQSDHLICWLKWQVSLGKPDERPVKVHEVFFIACNAFARCAFGQLSSLTSNFPLERIGF